MFLLRMNHFYFYMSIMVTIVGSEITLRKIGKWGWTIAWGMYRYDVINT